MDLSLLDTPYDLSEDQIELYRDNAYVKLENVLSIEVVEHFDRVITQQVRELNTQELPLEDRSTYHKAFLQVMNIWTKSEVAKQLVFSKRLARIAAELMGTRGVRLYHDQALYKEAGGGHTPWHCDSFYWPLASEHAVTAWIPLQATPVEMGPMEFAAKSHTFTGGRDLGISDESEAKLGDLLIDYQHIVEPFDVGEVSFHASRTYHRAGPNTTERARKVMCVIYMDEAMRLKEPENSNQRGDWQAWCPGAEVGEVIDTPLNPVLYSND